VKRRFLTGILAVTLALALVGCGAGKEGPTDGAITGDALESADESEDAAEADVQEDNDEETANQASGDEGKYVIYEYEASGQKVDHDMLVASGMGDTYLWLKSGGEAELYLFNESVTER